MELSDIRKAAGFLTQAQLADKLNLKRAAVAKWETGRTSPKTLMIPRLAALLNVTESEVISAISAAISHRVTDDEK